MLTELIDVDCDLIYDLCLMYPYGNACLDDVFNTFPAAVNSGDHVAFSAADYAQHAIAQH